MARWSCCHRRASLAYFDEVAIEEDDDDVDDDEDDDMVAHLGPDACVSRRRGVAPS